VPKGLPGLIFGFCVAAQLFFNSCAILLNAIFVIDKAYPAAKRFGGIDRGYLNRS